MAPAVDRVLGSYVLRSVIGRGGMSVVWLAQHRFLGDRVAIKELQAHVAAHDIGAARFLAEATRTRAIDHANVVRVLDVGRDEATGSLYLVMELVEGEDLAARLARVGRLDEASVRRVSLDIAAGMEAAHERGIVHRDLKPANVLLVPDGRAKIVDFGISKDVGTQPSSATHVGIGTPAYMAPEQVTGGVVAPCVDVWALGVILFEALTGRLPFAGFADGRWPQLFETPPRPGELVEVSASLDALIVRCLDRDPAARPASMREVAAALRDGADERVTQVVAPPSAAVPRSAPPSPERPALRRATRAATGVAMVAIVAVIATATWLTTRLESAPARPARGDRPPLAAFVAIPRGPDVESALEPGAPVVPAAPPPAASMRVEVRSRPSGAGITVDGVDRGVTPAALDLAGAATLTLTRRGSRPARVRVDQAGVIDVGLTRLPRKAQRRETLD